LAGTVSTAYFYNALEKKTAMFENRLAPFDHFETPGGGSSKNVYAYQYNTSLNRFRSSLVMGRVSRLKNRIIHLPQWLYDLNVLKPDLTLRGSFYAGIQVVPIHSIIGSEGKITDFDMGFHPIQEASRERWVGLAMAYIGYLPLPPVELIRIGDAYFVRDGHHRISVSCAFGQTSIDAEVIAWQAAPPFPWQMCCVEVERLSVKHLDPSTDQIN
jgi:hypothetical protein